MPENYCQWVETMQIDVSRDAMLVTASTPQPVGCHGRIAYRCIPRTPLHWQQAASGTHSERHAGFGCHGRLARPCVPSGNAGTGSKLPVAPTASLLLLFPLFLFCRAAPAASSPDYVWWEGENSTQTNFPTNKPFGPKNIDGNAHLLSNGDWLNSSGKR